MPASQRTAVGQVPRVPPTNLTYNKKPGRVGWWVGVGKAQMYPSPSVYSFCPPFPVFNLVNTCCSYNMLRGQHPPHPPPPPPQRFHSLQLLAPPICLPIGPSSCSAFQPYCAPAPTPAPRVGPHYASGQLRNNRRGQGSKLLEFPYTNPLTHTHTHALVGIHYAHFFFFSISIFSQIKAAINNTSIITTNQMGTWERIFDEPTENYQINPLLASA